MADNDGWPIGRLFVLDIVNGDDANDGSSVEQAVKTEGRLWELIDAWPPPPAHDVVLIGDIDSEFRRLGDEMSALKRTVYEALSVNRIAEWIARKMGLCDGA